MGPADRVFASVKTLGSHLKNGDTLAVFVSHESGSHSLISAILATPFDGRFAVLGPVHDVMNSSDPLVQAFLAGEARATT